MNTNPNNILPSNVRDCSTLSIIQMFFNFIDRRHSAHAISTESIKSAESYLGEIQHYVKLCSSYEHLHKSLDIANRYLSVAELMIKQMKGELS